MNDALEILDEIEVILDNHTDDHFHRLVLIEEYVHQKRLEFAEPKGDCCG